MDREIDNISFTISQMRRVAACRTFSEAVWYDSRIEAHT